MLELELRLGRARAAPHERGVELARGEHAVAALGVQNLAVVREIVPVVVPVPVALLGVHELLHAQQARGRREERGDEHVVGHEAVLVVAVLAEERGDRVGCDVRGVRRAVAERLRRRQPDRLEPSVRFADAAQRDRGKVRAWHDTHFRRFRGRASRNGGGVVVFVLVVENLRVLETVDVVDIVDVVLLLETVILFLHDVVHAIALLLLPPARRPPRAPDAHEHAHVAVAGDATVPLLVHPLENARQVVALAPRRRRALVVLALHRGRQRGAHARLEPHDRAAHARRGVLAESRFGIAGPGARARLVRRMRRV